MRFSATILLLLTAAAPALSQAPVPVRPGSRPRLAGAPSEAPRTYLAAGPVAEANLARLREAIARLPGISKVEVRAGQEEIAVTIDGDGASSQSMLVAAARAAGYRMRPAPTRFYRAVGAGGVDGLERLRKALGDLPGTEQLALSPLPEGAAVQVGGSVRHGDLIAAAKSAGFTMQVLASYVASGSTAPADLARLRKAMEKVRGVEQLELRGLTGGATLLVSGPANEDQLSAAGKTAGFIVWPLGSAESGREFRIQGSVDAAGRERLSSALKEVEGIGETEIREDPEGVRLSVRGAMVRPQVIFTAAQSAGFQLLPIQTVSLPSVEPKANRNTPPDYENRVLEDQAIPGAPAPAFSLLDKDGVTWISLADLTGKRPVVLLFGSCT